MKINKSYNKPTLDQIVTEIFLEGGTLTIDKIFEIVPILRSKGYSKLEMQQGFDPRTGITNRFQCWNEDKTQVIQISPDLLIVNKKGNYPGWTAFKQVLDIGMSSLKEVVQKFKVVAVRLHTIDQFRAPIEGYSTGRYLNCDGKFFSEWCNESKEAIDIVIGKGVLDTDNFNKQINVSIRPSKEDVSFTINSTFHSVNINTDHETLLESLHNESNNSFESIITDAVRDNIMGGEKK